MDALSSDETKIRWLLEGGVEAFNDVRPKSAVAPFADDWVDRTSGVRRDRLHTALVAMAFQERGHKSGIFPWVLTLPEERLMITVLGDDRAKATFECVLTRNAKNGSETAWRFRVDAELRDGDDGWEITATEHETLEGRRP